MNGIGNVLHVATGHTGHADTSVFGHVDVVGADHLVDLFGIETSEAEHSNL
eukprot:CAMPEP_0175895212 /NCGR_PEP_ID=MMETSP0107_2-20121207/50396_1 /TAXON_ID=195067 ORGANISM="Goniomonas pacifica, Strain CCMP1869" /NCGR_SAMPLE_ID=MMETSP0107_2 /ASSEMBLY_ACC=CAM_ASM_000203 /LENGTH=50 /DNA_ID=CAMNT_0017216339 /DNA_START=64 /DNA_END=216 /DNA_ORIENTATION=-